MSDSSENAPLDLALRSGSMVAVRRMRAEQAWVLTIDGRMVILTVDAATGASMHVGDEVELRVGIREGAAWFVEGEVAEVVFQRDGATVHVRTTSVPERRQQRRHLRIPAFDVELSLRSQRDTDEREWLPAVGYDISAGGVRFSSEQRLRVGELVDAKVHLPSDRQSVDIEARGIIVWGQAAGDEGGPRIPMYALAFKDLTPAVEDRIAGWVLTRQTNRLG